MSLPRTVDWDGEAVVIVEQTLLPHRLERVRLTDVGAVIDAIVRLAVRGAPAIGVTGALGVALAARLDPARRAITDAAEAIATARPTAVNLRWAVERTLRRLDDGPEGLLDEALAILAEDAATCRALGERGADFVVERCGARPLAVQTHCNAGALATVEWGTALGIVRSLHARGLIAEVLVDETRPLLQGARITAFELEADGIPYRVQADGAGPSAIAGGMVDVVIVGADRVAANGDTANKLGTYPLALAAARAGVPFVVAAPESTLDPATPDGAHIEIEQRSEREVLELGGVRITPPGARAWNPAFDVTPHDLVTAVATERRIWCPSPGGVSGQG